MNEWMNESSKESINQEINLFLDKKISSDMGSVLD